jgi:hypothetical protein
MNQSKDFENFQIGTQNPVSKFLDESDQYPVSKFFCDSEPQTRTHTYPHNTLCRS